MNGIYSDCIKRQLATRVGLFAADSWCAVVARWRIGRGQSGFDRYSRFQFQIAANAFGVPTEV